MNFISRILRRPISVPHSGAAPRSAFRIACASVCAFLLSLTLCASASESGTFVFDDGLLLDEIYVASLERQAEEIAERYNFGVYLIIVNNFEEYGYADPYDCAVAFYEDSNMGFGGNHDGELLFMSMEDRQYALVYAGYGETAFTEGGRDTLERAILSRFRNNDWEGGFTEYYRQSAYLLSEAASGEPVGWDEYGDYRPDDGAYMGNRPDGAYIGNHDDGGGWFGFLFAAAAAALISGAICAIFLAQMKSARPASRAQQYAVPNSLHIRERRDQFTHATETRVKIEKRSNHDGGSGLVHHSGGGHSGRSGSF